MKVSTLLPLLLSSSALAAANHRRTDVYSSRQVKAKRGLVDVCAALDVDVAVGKLPNGKNLVAAHLDLCLCLSVLPNFTRDNSIGKQVKDALGEAGSQDYFRNLIQGHQSKKDCRYPDHSKPFCDKKNPCSFTCEDGFKPFPPSNPTMCVCDAPNKECNGKCGNFPTCGSQAPVPPKKSRRSTPTCAPGKTLCGIAGGSNGKGYDCVDVQCDVESCGGCMAESPFGGAPANGVNCRKIEHATNVECRSGTCAVLSCEKGFKPCKTGSSCIPENADKNDSPYNHVLDLLVKEGLIVDIPGLLVLKEKLGLAATVLRRGDDMDIDHLLALLLKEGLIVEIPDILWLKEKLGLDATVLRRGNDQDIDHLLTLLLKQGLIVDIPGLLKLKEKLGLSATVLRRGEDMDVDHLLALLLKEGLIVEIPDILWLKEKLGLSATVLRRGDDMDIDYLLALLLKEGLIVEIPDILWLKEKLGLDATVLRRGNDQDIDHLLTLLLKQGLIVDIPGLLKLKEKLGLGLTVL